MAAVSILHSRPDIMTTRARLFLSVVAFRNVMLGICLLVAPEFFSAPNRVFDLVRELAPLDFWGWVMVLIGAMATHAVLAESRSWARAAVYASAGVSGVWTASLTIQFFTLSGTAPKMSPMLPLLWLALTCKDLILAWQPMRSPLESVIRRTADHARSDEELDDELERIEQVIARSQRMSVRDGHRLAGPGRG